MQISSPVAINMKPATARNEHQELLAHMAKSGFDALVLLEFNDLVVRSEMQAQTSTPNIGNLDDKSEAAIRHAVNSFVEQFGRQRLYEKYLYFAVQMMLEDDCDAKKSDIASYVGLAEIAQGNIYSDSGPSLDTNELMQSYKSKSLTGREPGPTAWSDVISASIRDRESKSANTDAVYEDAEMKAAIQASQSSYIVDEQKRAEAAVRTRAEEAAHIRQATELSTIAHEHTERQKIKQKYVGWNLNPHQLELLAEIISVGPLTPSQKLVPAVVFESNAVTFVMTSVDPSLLNAHKVIEIRKNDHRLDGDLERTFSRAYAIFLIDLLSEKTGETREICETVLSKTQANGNFTLAKRIIEQTRELGY